MTIELSPSEIAVGAIEAAKKALVTADAEHERKRMAILDTIGKLSALTYTRPGSAE